MLRILKFLNLFICCLHFRNFIDCYRLLIRHWLFSTDIFYKKILLQCVTSNLSVVSCHLLLRFWSSVSKNPGDFFRSPLSQIANQQKSNHELYLFLHLRGICFLASCSMYANESFIICI